MLALGVVQDRRHRVRQALFDPWIDKAEAEREYGIRPADESENRGYDAIILAVEHREFVACGYNGIHAFGRPNLAIYDIKNVLLKDKVDGRL
jgi:UDP-N-acetyl-D-galactosamine dehydrogenase